MDEKTIKRVKKICDDNRKRFNQPVNDSNVFSVFRIQEMEIRHSNFLE